MTLLRPYRLYTERRLNRRFAVELGARVELPELNLPAKVVDVSREGLKLVTPDYLKPEQSCNLHLDLPGDIGSLNLTAKVVSCRLIPRERQFVVGVRLTGASAAKTPELQQLIARLADEQNN